MKRVNPMDAALDDALVQHYAVNILAKYDRTDEVLRAAGREWYRAAHRDCLNLAHKHGLRLEQIAGAAAAISPGMRWELVLDYVGRLAAYTLKRRKLDFNVPTYSRLFVERAQACLRGKRAPLEALGGPKVTAFYMLLVDPSNGVEVCVDGHAYNIALGIKANIRGAGAEVTAKVGGRLTLRRYGLVADAYRAAAAARGLLPHEMQAVTWVQHRQIDQDTASLPF